MGQFIVPPVQNLHSVFFFVLHVDHPHHQLVAAASQNLDPLGVGPVVQKLWVVCRHCRLAADEFAMQAPLIVNDWDTIQSAVLFHQDLAFCLYFNFVGDCCLPEANA